MLNILLYRLLMVCNGFVFIYFSTKLPTEKEQFLAVGLSALIAVYTLFEGGIAQTILRIVAFSFERKLDVEQTLKNILILRNQSVLLMVLICFAILILSLRMASIDGIVTTSVMILLLFSVSIAMRLFGEILVNYIEGMQKVKTAYFVRLLSSLVMFIFLMFNIMETSLFWLLCLPNLMFIVALIAGALVTITLDPNLKRLKIWSISSKLSLNERPLRVFQFKVYLNSVIGFATFGTIVPITSELSGLEVSATVGLLLFGVNITSSILGIPLSRKIASFGPLFAKNELISVRNETIKLIRITMFLSVIGLIVASLASYPVLFFFTDYDLLAVRHIYYVYLGATAQIFTSILLNIVRASLVDNYLWLSSLQAFATISGVIIANFYGGVDQIAFVIFIIPVALILPITWAIARKERILG